MIVGHRAVGVDEIVLLPVEVRCRLSWQHHGTSARSSADGPPVVGETDTPAAGAEAVVVGAGAGSPCPLRGARSGEALYANFAAGPRR